MTARDFLRMVREGWAIILASAVVFTVVGVAYTATRTPTYQSTATLSVSACAPLENTDACDPVSGISFAVQRARIYASVGTSAPVLRAALEDTDAVQTRARLADAVSVVQASDSPLVEVTAVWDSPDDAAEIANAVAGALIDYATESIDNVESDFAQVQFDVISEATPPIEPTASSSRTILLAAMLGLLTGLALAFVRWLSDKRFRDVRDIEEVTGIGVLAELPIGGRSRAKVVAAVAQEGSSAAEFHQLRTVVSTRLAETASVIAVIAPGNSARGTVVSEGLATSFAATRRRVAVLHLEAQREPLVGQIELSELLEDQSQERALPQSNPLVITYGGGSGETSVMLGTPEFAATLARLSLACDLVLIDTSSEGTDAEMTGAARHANSALLVVESGRTKRQDVGAVLRALDLVQVEPLGIAAVTTSKQDKR